MRGRAGPLIQDRRLSLGFFNVSSFILLLGLAVTLKVQRLLNRGVVSARSELVREKNEKPDS